MKGHNIDWKKNEKSTPTPQEVDVIKPVIAEHASQCTATSFC